MPGSCSWPDRCDVVAGVSPRAGTGPLPPCRLCNGERLDLHAFITALAAWMCTPHRVPLMLSAHHPCPKPACPCGPKTRAPPSTCGAAATAPLIRGAPPLPCLPLALAHTPARRSVHRFRTGLRHLHAVPRGRRAGCAAAGWRLWRPVFGESQACSPVAGGPTPARLRAGRLLLAIPSPWTCAAEGWCCRRPPFGKLLLPLLPPSLHGSS